MKTKRLVYADYAATSPLRREAWEAMRPWLEGKFGNPSSAHSFGREARQAVEESRATIAECIGGKTEEVFFTSGGTEANTWVVKGTTGGLVVSSYEHPSVMESAESERRMGRAVTWCRPKVHGVVMSENLRKALREAGEGVGVVSVMAANNEIGTLNPVESLVGEAHSRKVLFHTDAVQAMGKVPVDVREWGVDFLSASAHKFGGPQGVGFLYARGGRAPERLLDGGGQERGSRAGTENVAGVVGMAAALRAACSRLEETTTRLEHLANRLREGLIGLFPDCVFPGGQLMAQVPGFVSVSLPGHPAEGMLHILDMKGIAVSAGAACHAGKTGISHVLKAIRLPRYLAECTLRISLGEDNTDPDVAAILTAFRAIRRVGK